MPARPKTTCCFSTYDIFLQFHSIRHFSRISMPLAFVTYFMLISASNTFFGEFNQRTHFQLISASDTFLSEIQQQTHFWLIFRNRQHFLLISASNSFFSEIKERTHFLLISVKKRSKTLKKKGKSEKFVTKEQKKRKKSKKYKTMV